MIAGRGLRAALTAEEKHMKIRFYNAGDKFSETFTYSLPDGHDVHCVARHLVDAPPGGFFQVPLDIEVGLGGIRDGRVGS